MDPKNVSALDPKLREVYERVMGTTTKPAASPLGAPSPVTPPMPSPLTPPKVSLPPLPAAQTSQSLGESKSAIDYSSFGPKSPPYQSPVTPSPMQSQPPVMQTPASIGVNSSPQVATSTTFGVVNAPEGKKKAETTEKKGSLMKTLLLFVGIPLFILIYAFIWIVVFGLEMPFAIPA